MDFLIDYKSSEINEYIKELEIVGSLSNLFSESSSPLIYYRATENIYCSCFKAKDVTRADCTADAIVGDVGIGIKTFIGSSPQKIAEFNKTIGLYNHLRGMVLAQTIATLRNQRIATTMRTYGLNKMIYHCVVREAGKIHLIEEPMNSINVANIVVLEENEKHIKFTDGIEKYNFSKSKSTLYKYFDVTDSVLTFEVKIFRDPIEILKKLFESMHFDAGYNPYENPNHPSHEELIIPLYTIDRNGVRTVCKKSGLNQWNAGGRKRNSDEVYIPFPAKLRKAHPHFFPDRNTKWNVVLPDGRTISMKVCQDNSKAIMSDPNKDLGKWLLRDVLNLREKELLTYDYLISLGIDSVIFKKQDGKFYLDLLVSED